jgi:hypothetical protein
MPLAAERIPFGPATITIGEGATALKFDGKDYLQVEGGELTITPSFEDETFVDTGTGRYDAYVTGYEGALTFTIGQESAKLLSLVLAASQNITDTTTSTVVGITDAPVGTSMRAKAQKVTIHPRSLPASDKSKDIVIYKMVSTGELSKSYQLAQGTMAVSLDMFPRDDMDASKGSSYFYTGPKDPNAAA